MEQYKWNQTAVALLPWRLEKAMEKDLCSHLRDADCRQSTSPQPADSLLIETHPYGPQHFRPIHLCVCVCVRFIFAWAIRFRRLIFRQNILAIIPSEDDVISRESLAIKSWNSMLHENMEFSQRDIWLKNRTKNSVLGDWNFIFPHWPLGLKLKRK